MKHKNKLKQYELFTTFRVNNTKIKGKTYKIL
jgi:hypothetical protein